VALDEQSWLNLAQSEQIITEKFGPIPSPITNSLRVHLTQAVQRFSAAISEALWPKSTSLKPWRPSRRLYTAIDITMQPALTDEFRGFLDFILVSELAHDIRSFVSIELDWSAAAAWSKKAEVLLKRVNAVRQVELHCAHAKNADVDGEAVEFDGKGKEAPTTDFGAYRLFLEFMYNLLWLIHRAVPSPKSTSTICLRPNSPIQA